MNGNGLVRTFANSADALRYLQAAFGSANYRSWQYLRQLFWDYQNYPEAGQSVFNFFGRAPGGTVTLQDTNMPKASSFGQQHFLVKAIRTRLFIKTWDLQLWDGLDATTLASDYLMGFLHAGVLKWDINARNYLTLPKPFLYAPPGGGEEQHRNRGIDALTLSEGTPNTLLTFTSAPPYATQTNQEDGVFLVDPNVLIEAEQNFAVSIEFPSGLVPVIGTGITDDTSNPLKIGVELDGILFRPVQ